MLENETHIIFPQKTMIKSAVQEYNGVKLRKTPAAIKAGKFPGESLPLLTDHFSPTPIGEATNFTQIDDEWRADVIFDKTKMNETDIGKLQRLERKDLSLGYKYDLEKLEDDEIYGDMENLRFEHLAWVESGRCSSKDGCGLDSSDKTQHAHDEVILMSECEEKTLKIKELEENLTANDADYKTQIEALNLRIEGYEAAEKVATIKEIVELSKFATDSLDKLPLDELKSTLEVLKMGKAADSYPPGDTVKKEDLSYDISKTQDMTKLIKKDGDK